MGTRKGSGTNPSSRQRFTGNRVEHSGLVIVQPCGCAIEVSSSPERKAYGIDRVNAEALLIRRFAGSRSFRWFRSDGKRL